MGTMGIFFLPLQRCHSGDRQAHKKMHRAAALVNDSESAKSEHEFVKALLEDSEPCKGPKKAYGRQKKDP